MVQLTINGKKIKAPAGQTILKAARDNGIHIPTLCSNDAVEPYGACRLCVVEIKSGAMASIESSCTYPVADGMDVSTDSPAVMKARKAVLELLLARCPNVKVIKDLAAEYGIEKAGDHLTVENEYCILCGLCVRGCHEVVKAGAISYSGNGKNKKVEAPFGEEAENCIGCGSCAFVCPTGIIKVRDVEKATENMPGGEVEIGDERIIDNWNRNLKMQACKISGNPIAPEYMLKRFRETMLLSPQFFNISMGRRECPTVDHDLCVGCGSCLEECPAGAMKLEVTDKNEIRNTIMSEHCCGCQTCTIYCVRSAIKVPALA